MRKPVIPQTLVYLAERSDTSCGIYPRAVFMTIFAKHPEAITEGGYYKNRGY